MKLIFLFAASLTLAVSASADLKKIQGVWKPTSGALGGKAMPTALLDKMVLTIKGDTYIYNEGHGDGVGTLKDVAGKPQGMDVMGAKGPNKGKTYVTIYKLEGANLTIVYGLGGKRPTSFDGKGPADMAITYHRSK